MKGIQFRLQKILNQIDQILLKPQAKITTDIFQFNFARSSIQALQAAQLIINQLSIEKHISKIFQKIVGKIKEARHLRPETDEDSSVECENDQIYDFLNSRKPINESKNLRDMDWYLKHMENKQKDVQVFLAHHNSFRKPIQNKIKQQCSQKYAQTDIIWINQFKFEGHTSSQIQALLCSIKQFNSIKQKNNQTINMLQMQLNQIKCCAKVQQQTRIKQNIQQTNLSEQNNMKQKQLNSLQNVKQKGLKKQKKSTSFGKKQTENLNSNKSKRQSLRQSLRSNKSMANQKSVFSLHRQQSQNIQESKQLQPLLQMQKIIQNQKNDDFINQDKQNIKQSNEKNVNQQEVEQQRISQIQDIKLQKELKKIDQNNKSNGNIDSSVLVLNKIKSKSINTNDQDMLQGQRKSIKNQTFTLRQDYRSNENNITVFQNCQIQQTINYNNKINKKQKIDQILQDRDQKNQQNQLKKVKYQINNQNNSLNLKNNVQNRYNMQTLRFSETQNNSFYRNQKHIDQSSNNSRQRKPLTNKIITNLSFHDENLKISRNFNNNYQTKMKIFFNKGTAKNLISIKQQNQLPNIYDKKSQANSNDTNLFASEQEASFLQSLHKDNYNICDQHTCLSLAKKDTLILNKISQLQKTRASHAQIKFYLQILQKIHHKKCGQSCIHLERYYKYLKFEHFKNNRVPIKLATRKIGFFS